MSTRVAPWSAHDVRVLAAGSIGGAVLIALGWFQAAGHTAFEHQVGWATAGALGVIVAGAANVSWILNGRRFLGARRRAVLTDPRLATAIDHALHAIDAGDDHAPKVARSELLYLRGASRFHRPDCLLVRGKPVKQATRSAHERARRRPCGVCEP